MVRTSPPCVPEAATTLRRKPTNGPRPRSAKPSEPTQVIGFLWESSRGYRLCPWKSPYLRWRMETYTGKHADQIGFGEFWSVVWNHRHAFLRFLRWADVQRERHL